MTVSIVATLLLGREPACDVVLDNPGVSRRHARLDVLADGDAWLTDLRSTNGTFAGGRRVRTVTTLAPGDDFAIGPIRLRYESGGVVSAAQPRSLRVDCRRLTVAIEGGPTLLDDVSFAVLPGEFVAIVGPSGAGKTTLLRAIGGLLSPAAGAILLNGRALHADPGSLRQSIGYVPQDDIVPPALTVEEALTYTAGLRLPVDFDRVEIRARVDLVLRDVALESERSRPIHRLSGGQRKRVSLAAELLAAPALLLLDEPVANLDPGLERRLMVLFRDLAHQGRTVLAVTHATQTVALCDRVAVLAPGGRLAYFGPPAEAPAYFGADSFAGIYTTIEDERDPAVWPERLRHAPEYGAWVGARLNNVEGPAGRGARGGRQYGAPRHDSSLRQVALLTRRQLAILGRDRRTLWQHAAVALGIGAVLTYLFRGPIFDTTPLLSGGTGNYLSANKLFFLLALFAVWFGTNLAAPTIVQEAALYARERHVGLSIIAYLGSKLIAFGLLAGLLSAGLLAPLLAKGLSPLMLVHLYAILCFGTLTGVGMGLAISAYAPDPARTNGLVPAALIPQVLLTGVIVELSHPALRALSWLLPTKWLYRALGATLDLDRVPMARQPLDGLPVDLAPHLTGDGSPLVFDAVAGRYMLLPEHRPEFIASPASYLLLLAVCLMLSLVVTALLLGRRDPAP